MDHTTEQAAPMYQLPCAYHLDKPSIGQCTVCRKSVCHDCFGHDMRGMLICKTCRLTAQRRLGPAWETPGELQVQAFLGTLFAAVRSPSRFMGSLPINRPWLPAFIFGIICICVGTLVMTMWNFMLNPSANDQLMQLIGKSNVPSSALRALAFARAVVFAPLIMAFHIFTLHAILTLAGVAADRATVARVFGYACAGYLFLLIPPIMGFPIGYMLMVIWLFNLEAHGLQHFYGISSTKATLIVLVPTFLGVMLQCF